MTPTDQLADPLPLRRVKLFIAAGEPNSAAAEANLRALQASQPNVRFDVEVIDVLQDYRVAAELGILITPCLVLLDPPPIATIVGTLSQRERVRAALRLNFER